MLLCKMFGSRLLLMVRALLKCFPIDDELDADRLLLSVP